MSKKKSEKKKDFWGDEYTQHYDDNGKKIGRSEEKKDFWGDKYDQHYDKDGKKIGTSEEKKDFWGDDYSQHYNKEGKKEGWSEEKKDFWGDEFTQHYNNDSKKVGRSENKKDFWGDSYREHQGKTYNTKSKRYTPPSTSSGDDDPLGIGCFLYLFATMAVIYIAVIAIVVAVTVAVLVSPLAFLIYYFYDNQKPKWALGLSFISATYLLVDFSKSIFVSLVLYENLGYNSNAGLIAQFSYFTLLAIPFYIGLEKYLKEKYPYRIEGQFLYKERERKVSMVGGILLIGSLFFIFQNYNILNTKTYSNNFVNESNQSQKVHSSTIINTSPSVPISPKYHNVKASQYLNVEDLHSYTRSELRIKRNELFAKYGYDFQTKEMKKYFSRQNWYKNMGRSEVEVLQFMTSLEKENIQKIKYYENQFEIKNGISAVINDPDGFTNVRSGESTSFPVIIKIFDNQKFTAYKSDKSNWWLVEFNDKRGFVHKSRIKEQTSILGNSFYIINISATKNKNEAQAKVNELINKGYKSNHLWIPDYNSLSGAEFFTVFIGPFYSIDECAIKVDEIRNQFPSAYGTLVSQENRRVEIKGVGKIEEILR